MQALISLGVQIFEFPEFPNSPMDIKLDGNVRHTPADLGTSSEYYPPYPSYEHFITFPVGSTETMEVDWIRVYSDKSCNNDVVYDCSLPNYPPQQITTLPSYTYAQNVTVGNNNYPITVNNYNIWADNAQENVNIVASNRITFKSGFRVEGGAKLHARIEDCSNAGARQANNNTETPPQYDYVLGNNEEQESATKQAVPDKQVLRQITPADSINTLNRMNKNFGLQENSFTATPNPFGNELTINSTLANYNITVYNATGAIVFYSPKPVTKLNTQEWASGMYNICLSNIENGITTGQKIVKK